ncbi:helix-turn-helix domain-containing protein [Micromonospora eburnea]|uniref:Uncharacterized protein n=1 Tax=Micromonospora eburnea TaxID=227316 RepID=A0A1C6TS63_9ACTN|nr:helix-turn-helix transcriptional regulator [Micromonospora eburnea]SCL44630.1 hypothetical protein GA0070604_0505 [Micromonospora eburnea]
MDDGETSIGSNGAEVRPRPGSAPDPFAATSPAEFVAAMRALKEWSGLTFRQLQRQAERFGEALPHSTIAAVLGRNNLPREALVTAFVRACGLDQATAALWLATRKRLAAQAVREAAPTNGVSPDPATSGEPPLAPEPVADASGGPGAPDETGQRPHSPTEVEPLPVLASVLRSVPLSDPEASGPSSDSEASGPSSLARDASPEPQHLRAATEGVTGAGSGDRRPDPPSSAGRLANVAAGRTDERWVGVHRHDPAEEVPRPAGLRWLVPPIMYRTGWASRVLSGVLVLVMAAIAVAVVARALRDSPGTAVGSGGPTESPVEEFDPRPLPAALPSSVPSPSASRSAVPRPRPSASTNTSASTKPATGTTAPAGPATGPVRLRVAHTGMCVGEGPELYKPSGRIVLGQHPCASASPPVIIEQVSGKVYRIKLDSPENGIGCATIDLGGRVDGLLLSGDVCGADRADQKFTFEPLTGAAGRYRVRSVPGKAYCIGVYGEHRDAGAQLIQSPCSSNLAQAFIVERR